MLMKIFNIAQINMKISCSRVERRNIKMMPPKAAYKFNEISINIPVSFFTEEIQVLKLLESQKMLCSHSNFEYKEQSL
jgi:hypothetical protein